MLIKLIGELLLIYFLHQTDIFILIKTQNQEQACPNVFSSALIASSVFRLHLKPTQTPDPPRCLRGLLLLSFHWSDRDVGCAGWDELKSSGRGCEESGSSDTEKLFFFSVFLIQTKRKTWRIRALNMCPCWTPPLRRTALRSWKIRSGWVCLTFTLFAQVTVGKVDTDRAQQNGVMWDSCPGNSYYSWSFQRLWNRFMFNVDETRNALNSLIRPSI